MPTNTPHARRRRTDELILNGDSGADGVGSLLMLRVHGECALYLGSHQRADRGNLSTPGVLSRESRSKGRDHAFPG